MTKYIIKEVKTLYKDYDVQKIDENVYKISEFNLATMYLVLGEKFCLSIDCGTGVKNYYEVVKKITDLPIILVSTHGHFDHTGGREGFDSIYVNPIDKDLLNKATPASRFWYILVNRSWGNRVGKMSSFSFKPIENQPEAKELFDRQIFDLGGVEVECHFTPGHTKGSVCFFIKEQNIIFTGDLVSPMNFAFFKESASVRELANSLEKVASLTDENTKFCYSHYHEFLPYSLLLEGVECAKEILKKKKGMGIGSHTYKTYTIFYKKSNLE